MLNFCEYIICSVIMIQRRVTVERSKCMQILDWTVLIFGSILIIFTGSCSVLNLFL